MKNQPVVLNTTEDEDKSPLILRPSWVPTRGPLGWVKKAASANRVTAEPIPAVDAVTTNVAAATTTVTAATVVISAPDVIGGSDVVVNPDEAQSTPTAEVEPTAAEVPAPKVTKGKTTPPAAAPE